MQIDWAWGIVEFHVEGRLTPMVIVDGFALLKASPQVATLRGIIWDVREADLSNLDAAGLSAALRASPFPDNVSIDFRIAAITRDEYAESVGATWIAVGKAIDTADRKLFRHLEDARNWAKHGIAPEVTDTVRASVH